METFAPFPTCKGHTMSKRSKSRNQHIAFYSSVAIFVGFFWVMPQIVNVTPAEIVGEGLGHVTDTWQVISAAAKIFSQGSKEIITGIGALAGVVYAIYHIVRK